MFALGSRVAARGMRARVWRGVVVAPPCTRWRALSTELDAREHLNEHVTATYTAISDFDSERADWASVRAAVDQLRAADATPTAHLIDSVVSRARTHEPKLMEDLVQYSYKHEVQPHIGSVSKILTYNTQAPQLRADGLSVCFDTMGLLLQHGPPPDEGHFNALLDGVLNEQKLLRYHRPHSELLARVEVIDSLIDYILAQHLPLRIVFFKRILALYSLANQPEKIVELVYKLPATFKGHTLEMVVEWAIESLVKNADLKQIEAVGTSDPSFATSIVVQAALINAYAHLAPEKMWPAFCGYIDRVRAIGLFQMERYYRSIGKLLQALSVGAFHVTDPVEAEERLVAGKLLFNAMVLSNNGSTDFCSKVFLTLLQKMKDFDTADKLWQLLSTPNSKLVLAGSPMVDTTPRNGIVVHERFQSALPIVAAPFHTPFVTTKPSGSFSVQRAFGLASCGRFYDAAGVFSKHCDWDNDLALTGIIQQAVVHSGAEGGQKMLNCLKRAVKRRFVKSFHAHAPIIKTYLQQGDTEAADEYFEFLTRLRVYWNQMHLQRLFDACREGNCVDYAEKMFESRFHTPKSGSDWKNVARGTTAMMQVFAKLGNTDKVMEYLNRYLALKPDQSHSVGFYTKALKALSRAGMVDEMQELEAKMLRKIQPDGPLLVVLDQYRQAGQAMKEQKDQEAQEIQ